MSVDVAIASWSLGQESNCVREGHETRAGAQDGYMFG